ncbi:transporter substrate-binding domain-containing protein [Legionella waltersii]|uniref:Arginine transport system periplasmic binding protein n=1 Tax=Legionella waltersii TaxID=66969 RepID=A0A0W1A5G8_9GAMM|nr:transporter substrate-binding domain-containing protein [Legionella waltersii]KTD76581.1 arginine transport system periplasmic binding protein [Legionella waltersii]SNU94455.1 arginine transport system substrate-binding protein [Legionella waltersii]
MRKYRLVLFLITIIAPMLNAYALKLTIGTLSYNPPFEIESEKIHTQQFFGFDIDLMNEICKRIEAECEYKAMFFNQIPEMLNSGQIDLAIASIDITPERSQAFLFSLPYKTSEVQFVTNANSNYHSIEDFKGKNIGVFLNSPVESYVTELFANDVQLKKYNNTLDLLNSLVSQQVDAVVTNTEQAQFWVTNFHEHKLVGKPYPIAVGYGIMSKLNNTDLMDQINEALMSMEKDGTYLQIYNASF